MTLTTDSDRNQFPPVVDRKTFYKGKKQNFPKCVVWHWQLTATGIYYSPCRQVNFLQGKKEKLFPVCIMTLTTDSDRHQVFPLYLCTEKVSTREKRKISPMCSMTLTTESDRHQVFPLYLYTEKIPQGKKENFSLCVVWHWRLTVTGINDYRSR